jgi:hypothetical protein
MTQITTIPITKIIPIIHPTAAVVVVPQLVTELLTPLPLI